MRFVDAFAGCGGLSLGLMLSGAKGLWGIEDHPSPFASLRRNLVEPGNSPILYDWPAWLPVEPTDIRGFMRLHRRSLRALRGCVDLLVGGPPCQGFSTCGERDPTDPRNRLFGHFLELVEGLRPALVLIENVRGIEADFLRPSPTKGAKRPAVLNFVRLIHAQLDRVGYDAQGLRLAAVDFGVPQLRPRFFLVAADRRRFGRSFRDYDAGALVDRLRSGFLASVGLRPDQAVTVEQAISDLALDGRSLMPCSDTPGFQQLVYRRPTTHYQRSLRAGLNGESPTSMRLARHGLEVTRRFAAIQSACRAGVGLSLRERASFKLKKHRVYVMNAGSPAPTLTSLPEDVLHYAEPRTLTVREYARLQSFPDWFEFLGPYTSGGATRKRQVPRFTQVANAVPVRLAQFLGVLLQTLAADLTKARQTRPRTRFRRST